MKRQLTALIGVIVCAGLAGCAAPNDQQLSLQTVQYRCSANGTQPLSVQYTFKGTEPLAAQVIYQNQAINLDRVMSGQAKLIGYTFQGNGYTWTTNKFTHGMDRNGDVDHDGIRNLDDADDTTSNNAAHTTNAGARGSMLTRDVPQTVNGQTTTVSAIVADHCNAVGTIMPKQ